MLDAIRHIDQSLFLYLNSLHSPFCDVVMFWATIGWVWIPLYILFLFPVIKKYKWQTWIILVFVTSMILASDQLATLAKDYFQRLRPSNDPALLPIHIVNGYRGGSFGFYSAHASNTFSVAVFLIFFLGKSYRYIIIPALLWALTMSYTRIYLGVHYPGDILAGIVAGSVLGFFSAKFCRKIMGIMMGVSQKPSKP
ncbi:MAG: phosphatase PAP2 family protein [Bacteroidetes bacterium]|nr:phosphatase PAP2 family protein [Bacteroidota bacterium]